ncbi:MAG TPA: hypothetical protein PKY96_17055 [Flavobacteriales bacterium]|nr:hypothetical protein [Flavobacteriales bacterium]
MKTRKPARIGLGLVIIAFGALTLFLSTSVLLDLFGIRERESPYVPAVVAANLIASLLYLPAGAGLLMQRRWSSVLLAAAVAVLLVGALFLALHINSGGIYRTATIGALTIRTLLTTAFYFIARWTLRAPDPSPTTPRT